MADYVMATVWSFCGKLLLPGGGLSVCKTGHRIWLRILSIALEKELEVLPWLCLMITLLFSLLRLFSFVSAFLTFLIKLIL